VRISLGLEVVLSAGERMVEPLYWPVYFAVDDPALRFLAGVAASVDWLHAPGPLPSGESPAWSHEVAATGMAGASYFGFGLLISDGGTTDETTQLAYEELLATLHTLALDHVAHGSGLGVMVGALGSDDIVGVECELDRLRDGLDPDELRNDSRPVAQPGAASLAAAARQRRRRLTPRPPSRVVAVTVQAWRVDEIAALGRLAIDRELPPRAGNTRVLRLTGGVGR
jgi:hypothetical protein